MDILASLEIRRVSGSELPQRLLLAADESREAVADYELYSADYVSLCKWVEKNTEPSDIF